jgi:hypothetical protein
MLAMTKIAFIIPYFGSFPKWMEYFVASCRENPSVDFIFFSDNETPTDWPSNMTYYQTSFTAYKRLVSDRLDIRFNPESAYKLCDIKPSYGLIHQDILKEYDYWGFCDIDVIFGNIRAILTDELLRKTDFFSAFGRRVAGHFCLMRNIDRYNRSFMEHKSWQSIFESQEHFCFDEKQFSDLYSGFKNYPKPLAKLLKWLTLPLSRRALFQEQYSTPELRYNWVDGSRNFPSEWYWKKGTLTNNASDREFLYLHFLKWKRDWGQQAICFSNKENINHEWKITKLGFEDL